MAERKYVCVRCDHKFVLEIITVEEARRENIAIERPRCIQCGNDSIVPAEALAG